MDGIEKIESSTGAVGRFLLSIAGTSLLYDLTGLSMSKIDFAVADKDSEGGDFGLEGWCCC